MNGRPNRQRRGRGKPQQGWRASPEDGNHSLGPKSEAIQHQDWGNRTDRRTDSVERPLSRGRGPQQGHWRAPNDKSNQDHNWRHRPTMPEQVCSQDAYQRRIKERMNEEFMSNWPKEDEARAADAYPQGTCTSMCPQRELQEREAQCRLHRFEMLAGTEGDRRPRADPARVVKEYSRPAAGKDATRASDLRPPSVLLKTVHYLIDEIAASTTLQPWTEVYSFVFDRLRSIRQDLIIQRAAGSECVAVLERCVRFLVYSSQRLCDAPLRLYDPKINDTHLQESLSWLLESYAKGIDGRVRLHPQEVSQRTSDYTGRECSHDSRQQNHEFENRAEFEALNLLYNLGSCRVMQHALELPTHVRSTPAVRLGLAVSRAFCERNPVRLLRLANRLDFLQGCALHRHLLVIRRQLLLLFSHAHSSRNCRYPLDHLAHLLGLEEPQTRRLCHVHGIAITGEWVAFSKTSFQDIPVREGDGDMEGTVGQCASTHVEDLEGKTEPPIATIIHGHV